MRIQLHLFFLLSLLEVLEEQAGLELAAGSNDFVGGAVVGLSALEGADVMGEGSELLM